MKTCSFYKKEEHKITLWSIQQRLNEYGYVNCYKDNESDLQSLIRWTVTQDVIFICNHRCRKRWFQGIIILKTR